MATIKLDVPDVACLQLPAGVARRLQNLLDKQDAEGLCAEERAEAEGLVDLAELLTLLKLRSDMR